MDKHTNLYIQTTNTEEKFYNFEASGQSYKTFFLRNLWLYQIN